MSEPMEEDPDLTDSLADSRAVSVDETGSSSPVVQVIMSGDGGDTLVPSGQLIEINTDDGQVQYLQVTNENGETQYIQLSADGQAHLVQFSNIEEESAGLPTDTADDRLPVVTEEEGVLNQLKLEPSQDQEKQEKFIIVRTEDGAQVEEFDEPSEVTNEENQPQISENQPQVLENELQVLVNEPQVSVDAANVQESTANVKKEDNSELLDADQAVVVSEQSELVKAVPAKPHPLIPDLSSPIDLLSETIITINSKKCLLKYDGDTGQLRAYPLKNSGPAPGKRPRGRPRKICNPDDKNVSSLRVLSTDGDASKPDKPSAAPTEQENNAAEGLLGLSEANGRRKSLRVKKKPHVLCEYEVGAIEGVEDPDEDDGAKPNAEDKEVTMPSIYTATPGGELGEKRGRGRPPKIPSTANQVQNFLANLGLPVKRGRGRPRRYPPPGSLSEVQSFIIPQSGGHAVMIKMPAPGQDAEHLNEQVTGSANDKVMIKAVDPPQYPPIIIQNEDGTQTHIVAGPPVEQNTAITLPLNASPSEQIITINTADDTSPGDIVPITIQPIMMHEGDQEAAQAIGNLEQAEFVECSMDTSQAVGKEEKVDEEQPDNKLAVVVQSVEEQRANDVISDMDVNDDNDEVTTDYEKVAADVQPEGSPTIQPPATITLPGQDGERTIIHVPQNLVPFLFSGKSDEPVKIGLKQTESDIEKLRCTKCGYQAYYIRQYQEHIADKHKGETIKCKCCYYNCFDDESLNQHYKEVHPKNFCSICSFRAEHAYVVKRHMMRHNSKGCRCHLCGKTYKDRYILKMHIKMVHMPAEVLFECNLCSKKFTRKAHLKRHMRIHDPMKPFKCPLCDYRGCERSDITKHIVIHNEPKYCCEVCGKYFRHMKNKDLHLKRHKGQRDYKCGMCDFYGYTFTDIRKHIDRKHADAKIVCDKCGCVFRSESLLAEHSKGCVSGVITMKPGDYSVMGDMVGDGTTLHIPSTHLGPDGQLLMDPNHDYIQVEQVDVQLPSEENVSLSDVQISEASIVESQLVEQHISSQQVMNINASDFSQAEIIQIPKEVNHNAIEGATHIQIPQTGELIKIEGPNSELSDPVEISEGVELVEESEFVEGVTFIEADQYTSSHLHSKMELIESSQLAEGVDDTELPDEAVLAIDQSSELTDDAELGEQDNI